VTTYLYYPKFRRTVKDKLFKLVKEMYDSRVILENFKKSIIIPTQKKNGRQIVTTSVH